MESREELIRRARKNFSDDNYKNENNSFRFFGLRLVFLGIIFLAIIFINKFDFEYEGITNKDIVSWVKDAVISNDRVENLQARVGEVVKELAQKN